MYVIELNRNGYNLGLQQAKIDTVFKKCKMTLASATKQNADTLISNFYQSTNFVLAIMKWAPEIYDEIKEITESSGQSFKDVYCYQMVDKFWVYLDKIGHTEVYHCNGMVWQLRARTQLTLLKI